MNNRKKESWQTIVNAVLLVSPEQRHCFDIVRALLDSGRTYSKLSNIVEDTLAQCAALVEDEQAQAQMRTTVHTYIYQKLSKFNLLQKQGEHYVFNHALWRSTLNALALGADYAGEQASE